MANQVGILFSEPSLQPLSVNGKVQPGCTRKFYFSQSTTVAPVYRDGGQKIAFTGTPTANQNGVFPPIYLDPTITYRSQLFNSIGQLLEDTDPYVTPPPFQFAVVKQGATNVVSNTTAVADPELQITIPGPGTYVFDALLEFITTGASGANPGVVVTPAFSGAMASLGKDTANSSFTIIGNMNAVSIDTLGSLNGTGAGAAGLVAPPYGLAGASVKNTIMFRGVFKATEVGVLSINWGQQTSNATATTLNAGSYLRYVGFGIGTDVSKGTGRPAVINPNTIQNPNLAIPAIFIATYNLSGTPYIYSKDGVNWKVGNFPSAVFSPMPAYGGPAASALWVVTTQTQTVFTSQDGVTWISRPTAMPNANAWSDIAWSPTLGLFVAVENNGNGHQAATSPDGINWTLRNTPAGNIPWATVIWSPTKNLFIAGNGTSQNTTPVMTSPDGITWTLRTTSTACNSTWARDLGSSFDVFGLLGGSASYAGSADGVNWSKFVTPIMPGSGSNSIGAPWVVGGVVYAQSVNTKLVKTSAVDLASGWTLVRDITTLGIAGTQASQNGAAFSARLGMWAMSMGPANNTQILTATGDGTVLTLYNPTVAVGSITQKMASAF